MKKLLLLIIPLLFGCTPEVTDVDELYSKYTCNVGTVAGPQNPEDVISRPDSINVMIED